MKFIKRKCGSLYHVTCFNDDGTKAYKLCFDSMGKRQGPFVIYQKDNKVKERGFYLNNNFHGRHIIYDEFGKISRKEDFKNGVPHGLVEERDMFGKKILSLHFQNGRHHGYCMWDYGKYKAIFNHGKAVQIEIKDYNGKTLILFKNGKEEVKRFWPNGKIREEYTAKNFIISGKKKTYDVTGKLVGQYTYVKNKLLRKVILKDGKWIDEPITKQPDLMDKIDKKLVSKMISDLVSR